MTFFWDPHPGDELKCYSCPVMSPAQGCPLRLEDTAHLSTQRPLSSLYHTHPCPLSHIHLYTLIHTPHTLTLTFSHICQKCTTSHTYAFSPDIPYTNSLALLGPSTHTTQSHTCTYPPTDLHLHVCTLITAYSHIHVLTDGHLRITHPTDSL